MQLPFKKEPTSDFSKPEIEQAFVQGIQSKRDLLQKELDINRAEQTLLQTRIRMMNEFINEIPASDPQYSMLTIQTRMDQVELDELKRHAETICLQLQRLLE